MRANVLTEVGRRRETVGGGGGGRQWGGEAGPETRGEGGMGWTHRALGGCLLPGFAEPEAPRGEGVSPPPPWGSWRPSDGRASRLLLPAPGR